LIHSQRSFQTGCAETLVNNYQSMLRNIQEERSIKANILKQPVVSQTVLQRL